MGDRQGLIDIDVEIERCTKKQKVAHPANQSSAKAKKADKPTNKIDTLIGREREEGKTGSKA